MKLGLKFKFLLVIINILAIIFTFYWAAVSTLVMIATIPAVVYSIYTKKWFLIVISVGIFCLFLFIFIMGVLNPILLHQFYENLNIIIYLYSKIYPYEINTPIYSLLSVNLLLYTSLFLFFVLLIGHSLKFDAFQIMLAFSFLVMSFSAIYLILNIFCYLIPPLSPFLVENFVMQWFFAFFYIILPFLTLNFILYYLEAIALDDRTRTEYKQDANNLRTKESKKLNEILKYIAIFIVLIFVIIVLGIILM